MNKFELFNYLDSTLVNQEIREPKPSRIPAVWPSEASAERIDKTGAPIVGKCMRASYCRMTARPVTNNVDARGSWTWVLGRMVEDKVVSLAKAAKDTIFVANGVKHYVPELYLPLELDLVVMDPETKQGWIAECKTYNGYYAEKEIEDTGTPKLENLMQICIYLLEMPNGKKLKEVIKNSVSDRDKLDKAEATHRNRIEANMELVDQMSDGPVGAKLIYLSRGECKRTEFDIHVKEDFDGYHYPVVNGMMYKIFTMESVYNRYKELQQYWFKARKEGVRRLKIKGVVAPETLKLVLDCGDTNKHEEELNLTEEQKEAEYKYLNDLAKEVLLLPDEFLPPAEYDYSYSAEKIERMNQAGLLTKKAYDGWKKRKERVGDFQCGYCNHKNYCVPKKYPQLAYQIYDIDQIQKAGTND